jgi:hypothetical protein
MVGKIQIKKAQKRKKTYSRRKPLLAAARNLWNRIYAMIESQSEGKK